MVESPEGPTTLPKGSRLIENCSMTTERDNRRIIVGVDESDGATAAIQWAVAESAFDNAELTAVLAWSFLDQHHAAPGEPFDPTYREDEAREAVERYIAGAVGVDDAKRIHARVVCDLPASALLGASAQADLLVVGARGSGGFSGLLLGSVAQQCLHNSPIPVAIIRPGKTSTDADGPRIVVAVDGSDTAQHALQWAIREARLRSSALDVVHAWQLPLFGYSSLGSFTFDPDVYEEESRRVVREAIDAEDTTGVRINPVSLCQETVSGILEFADGASLLVTGSRGYGPLKRTVFGSVATQFSHHASCPLVVVPPIGRATNH